MSDLIANNLKYNLLDCLKQDDLWNQFLEAFGEEIAIERITIFDKKDLFGANTQKQDRLLDLCKMFGYTPNLMLDNSLVMLKSEYLSIPYRIRFKTTYDGYFFIFRQANAKGDVYNYYYDGNKLVKAMNYDSCIDNVLSGGYKFGSIFTVNDPDKNFSTIMTGDSIHLDTDIALDVKKSNYKWYLDKNLYILPTKHLGIEIYPLYLMENDEGTECIMNKHWFEYMAIGADYNRRVPIVPHLGLQLSVVITQNKAYNYLTPNSDYTIEDLKLRASTVFSFNKNFTNLDVDGGISEDEFKYICCGDGKLSLPNNENFNIFPYDDMILFYNFDDDDSSEIIFDYSMVENDGKLYGDTVKVNGITSKTINFNGETYVKTENSINFDSINVFSINFWLKANNAEYMENTDNMCVFDIPNFLKATYNYSDRLLTFNYSNNFDVEVDFNEDAYFNVEIGNNNIIVYKNGVEVANKSFTETAISNVYIGADSSLENYFIGIIDSFYIMSKIFTSSEKQYIYDNKLSIITHLDNFMARYKLSKFSEIYDRDNIKLIQSHVDAFDINDEFIFKVKEEQTKSTVYIGNVKRTNLLSKYFKYTYTKKDLSLVTIKANESGEFYTEDGSFIRGNIDYKKGIYTIYAYDRNFANDVNIDISGTPSSTIALEGGGIMNVFNNIQLNANIENSSMTYVVTDGDGKTYKGSSNGNEIIGTTNIIFGSFDLDSGVLSLAVNATVKSVIISYSYFKDMEMKSGTDVIVEYKIDEGYISEIGLENENHQLLAYMTFPKVEFNSIQDFISVGFYMLK